ncbi:MAG: glycosyltransferase family 4 protein [Rhodoferax sp.]|uniref:glycosyltransferase family 4 protein n=1 Tax=Rhodoferax sp. TaxID=50421 RepID=UPI00301A65C2
MKTVMLLGPSLEAVSGVSTHLNQLMHSHLVNEFNFVHFQVGSQGRNETAIKKTFRLVFSPLQFFWRMLQQSPHIIHVNTTMDPKGYWRDMVYLLIARSLGKKIVYQVHGGALPQFFFRNSQVLSYLLKWILRTADLVVVLGQESLTAYRSFIPGLNVEAIPNAITPGEDPYWKRTPIRKDKPLCLVYVGRLAESKGVLEIIDALAILHRDKRSIYLTVAGLGPAEVEMRKKVTDHDLHEYVKFVGIVHGAEKERIWVESDLFVFPTYHEALPYALLESMAARTPPLISPVGEIPDVVEDGVHGLFVPQRNPQALATAISRLDNDRDLINRMGESGRQRIVNYYTNDRLANDFGSAYLDVLSRNIKQVTMHA